MMLLIGLILIFQKDNDVRCFKHGKEYMLLELRNDSTFIFNWRESYHKEINVYMTGDFSENDSIVQLFVKFEGETKELLSPTNKTSTILLVKKKRLLFLNNLENGTILKRCKCSGA
jgi:hypothetical protein